MESGNAHGFAVNDSWGLVLDGAVVLGGDGALAVNGSAQRIDNAADEGLAHRDTRPFFGPGNLGALPDSCVGAEQDAADLIFSHVLNHSLDSIFKYHDLAVHGLIHSVYGGDSVTDPDNLPDLLIACIQVIILNLFLED